MKSKRCVVWELVVGRPDITVMVDWALKTNNQSINGNWSVCEYTNVFLTLLRREAEDTVDHPDTAFGALLGL